MWLDFALAVLCAFAVIALYWRIEGFCTSGVYVGDETTLEITVTAEGNAACLEQTLGDLVHLRNRGTLKADISVILYSESAAVWHIAEVFSSKYAYINLNYGDSSWTNSTN